MVWENKVLCVLTNASSGSIDLRVKGFFVDMPNNSSNVGCAIRLIAFSAFHPVVAAFGALLAAEVRSFIASGSKQVVRSQKIQPNCTSVLMAEFSGRDVQLTSGASHQRDPFRSKAFLIKVAQTCKEEEACLISIMDLKPVHCVRVRKAKVARLYDSRKRILVTGGAEFIGSHLIDRLLAGGHEVICLDNLFTGTKRNIDHLHDNPRFEFMRHDVTFPSMSRLMRSTISPARPHRCITNTTQYKRRRPACMAR